MTARPGIENNGQLEFTGYQQDPTQVNVTNDGHLGRIALQPVPILLMIVLFSHIQVQFSGTDCCTRRSSAGKLPVLEFALPLGCRV